MGSGEMASRHTIIISLAAFLALCVAFCAQPAHARRAEIVDAGQELTRNLVLIHFRVDGAFTEGIVEAVHSGASTTFTYNVRLFREVPHLLDTRLFGFQFERTVRYDTLKQTYDVSDNGRHRTADSLEEAERLMTAVNELPVALRSAMEPQASYYVLVKAELAEVELPFVFSPFRFLVAPFDFETGWVRIDLLANE